MTSARCLGAAVLLLVPIGLLAACDTEAQFAPSLTRVVGLQVDQAGQLVVLTGAPCEGVDRVVVVFSGDGDDDGGPVRTQLSAEPATTMERIGVGPGVVADGFTTTEALPEGFDWRAYSEMDVVISGPAGEVGGASSDLEPVKTRGAEHVGDGTAYVRDEGWLTPAQITAGDAKDFLTACTPDPAKTSG